MQPDEATFLLRFLLPQLTSEQAITKKILASVPPGQEHYKPHADSRSALRLSVHIALMEIWVLDAVIHRQFGATLPLPENVRAGREIAEWYEDRCRERLPLLEALSGEDLATPVSFHGLRNDPAVAYLNIAIRHSVHHRGQLSAYLRPMGAKVPAIYLESGDEPYPPAEGVSEQTAPPPVF